MEATTCLEILSICSIIVFCAHSLPTMDCQENEYWDQWGRCVTCQLCGPGQELSKVNTPGQDTYFCYILEKQTGNQESPRSGESTPSVANRFSK